MQKTIVSRKKEITIEMEKGIRFGSETIVGRLEWAAGNYFKWAVFSYRTNTRGELTTLQWENKSMMSETMVKEMTAAIEGMKGEVIL